MSKFLSFSLIFILVFFACPNIFADQIVLKNGDRLTGKIVKKDGDKITIETEAAGTVSILWTAVEKIVSEEPLNIELTDGQLIRGTVAATAAEKLEVTTTDARTVEVQKENVEIVRSEAEQSKFDAEQERFLNPGFFELWRGTADLGFSLTSGNSDTKAFSAGVRANRETNRDKISFYANAIQASNATTGVSVTTAQAVYGGVRYDYNVNKKLFVFGSGDFEYDKPQQLDLRSVLGGGFGYKFIRSEKTRLDIFGGATYNRENFSNGVTRNSAEALIGDELSYKLTESIALEQRLAVYPGLSEFGEFRAFFDASVITKLNSWLGWQFTVGNRYNSNPVPRAVSNDFLFTTGLRATFGRNNK